VFSNYKIQNKINLEKELVQKYLDILDSEYMNKLLLKSYSPYSNYKVASILVMKDNSLITGINIENGSFGLTNCAERVAIGKAVSEGYSKSSDYKAVIIKALNSDLKLTDLFSPCGACRQVLNEICGNVIVVFPFKGEIIITNMEELLPYNFNL
jgi:cytidine deaminase